MSANGNTPARTWTWLWMALAALLIGALALAAACSGDDDDDGNGGDDDGGSSPTATQPAGDDGGDDDGGDDGGDDADDIVAELSNITSDYEAFEGYVKYSVSGDLGTGLTSMSIYQEGDNSRFDIESSEGDIILINTSDATYFCSEDQCIKYELGDDTATGFTEGFTDLVDADTVEEDFVDAPNVDYDIFDDNIAGLDATCFSTTGDLDEDVPGDEVGEVCFSNDGALMLRISTTSDEGTYSMEATEASTDVPGGSFDPPFEVIDFGGLFDN